MAIQLGTTLRNNMIGQYETTLGTTPKLILRSGAPPAAANSVDSGTFLAILTLPSDWLNAASAGAVTLLGTWSGTGTSAGTAGHYRLKDSTATSTDNTGTTHEQGTVGQGSGDLSLDNNVIAASQAISITTWTRTQGGA
jgi:hypothetical protein